MFVGICATSASVRCPHLAAPVLVWPRMSARCATRKLLRSWPQDTQSTLASWAFALRPPVLARFIFSMACTTPKWTQPRCLMLRHVSPRAMLGINLGTLMPSAPHVTDGVQIVSVSPGGPADVAGLKANDVIVSFGGKELRNETGQSPQQVLSALMFDAEAAEPITVEYRRDGKLQKTQIVPKSWPTFLSESIDHGLQGLEKLYEFNPLMRQPDLSGFGSAELLELSPALGQYFGTAKGLLVVRAPSDDRLKLQDGDVIIDIDGRVPTAAAHALQILNSYREGEKLKLHIMRQQKQVELTIEILKDSTHPETYRFERGAGDISWPRI
jgi:predicted metalloprotease with PDZ domain